MNEKECPLKYEIEWFVEGVTVHFKLEKNVGDVLVINKLKVMDNDVNQIMFDSVTKLPIKSGVVSHKLDENTSYQICINQENVLKFSTYLYLCRFSKSSAMMQLCGKKMLLDIPEMDELQMKKARLCIRGENDIKVLNVKNHQCVKVDFAIHNVSIRAQRGRFTTPWNQLPILRPQIVEDDVNVSASHKMETDVNVAVCQIVENVAAAQMVENNVNVATAKLPPLHIVAIPQVKYPKLPLGDPRKLGRMYQQEVDYVNLLGEISSSSEDECVDLTATPVAVDDMAVATAPVVVGDSVKSLSLKGNNKSTAMKISGGRRRHHPWLHAEFRATAVKVMPKQKYGVVKSNMKKDTRSIPEVLNTIRKKKKKL